MIVYDTYAYSGLYIFLQITGSALFSVRSLIPALFSAGLTALLANYDPIVVWLHERSTQIGLGSLGIQFLVTFLLVNRIQLGNIRFRTAHTYYGQFHHALLRLATLLTSCLDACPNQSVCPEVLAEYRSTYLRWIRAVHILALEEFQGCELPKYRMGVLLLTEEIALFNDNRRGARLIRWLTRSYHKHRALIAPGTGVDGRMMNILDDVLSTYGTTLVSSQQLYPFPLTQSAFICVVAYAVWAPLLFSVMMPHSWFLAVLLCFSSVWLTFGLNLAAQLMEWPFDGKANDLPFAYFGMRFMKEVSEIEFGTDAPLISHTLDKLLGEEAQLDEDKVDYVVPKPRLVDQGRRRDTKAWLDEALVEIQFGAQTRKLLRDHLEPLKPRQFVGNTMAEIRASGSYRVLT